LRTIPAGAGIRVLPVTNPSRAARLIKAAPAHVVVGTPGALAGLLRASALQMDAVHTLVLASVDEYEAQMEPLGALMAELPRGSARVLTAADATPLVEQVLERYLHKARRVVAPEAAPVPVAAGTPPTLYVRLVAAHGPIAPIGELLDELDPPSAAIIVPDARTEGRVHTALEALGYAADSPLVSVTRGPVALHTALVLFAGLPDATQLAAALDAHPARLVALVTARQRASLEKRAAGVVVMPYERSRAARAAREKEETLRGVLRTTLAEGLPAREIVALEPLLTEFDGLEVAGAALRLYERAVSDAAAAKLSGREEMRAELKAAKTERDASEARLAHPRGFDRPKPGGFDRPRPPRGRSDDRSPRGRSDDRGPRSRGPSRDDKGRPPRREK
jgi:hypothetical protein